MRIAVLIICIMLLAVLFINGIYILSGSEFILPGNGNNTLQPDRSKVLHAESSLNKDYPVNLLLLGLDEDGYRTDVIILVNFDPVSNSINALSLARDTRVFFNGKHIKINALYAKGREIGVADMIREITGLSIHYYITFNFAAFREAIDLVGGVRFNVPFDMKYDDPYQKLHIHLNKGWQRLNGEKAEQLVRYRKGNRRNQGYVDGDIGRINMQQAFLKAFIEQKMNIMYLSKAGRLMDILSRYCRTNISINDMAYYLPELKKIHADSYKSFVAPGQSLIMDGVWYFIVEKEKLDTIINKNFRRP